LGGVGGGRVAAVSAELEIPERVKEAARNLVAQRLTLRPTHQELRRLLRLAVGRITAADLDEIRDTIADTVWEGYENNKKRTRAAVVVGERMLAWWPVDALARDLVEKADPVSIITVAVTGLLPRQQEIQR
jgi:hypothetical protein